MERQSTIDYNTLAQRIKGWGRQLGFQRVGIADTELREAECHLANWLARGFHGEMAYMHKHGPKRTRPCELVPGTLRVISVRMDYLPEEPDPAAILDEPARAFISRYALGRDYHKVIRRRLQRLAARIEVEVGPFGYRAFVDRHPGRATLRQLHGMHRLLPDAGDRCPVPGRCPALHLLPDDRARRQHPGALSRTDWQPHLRL